MSRPTVSVMKCSHAKRRAFLAVLASLPFATARSEPARPDAVLVARIARRYRVEPSAVERVIALAEKYFPADPSVLLAIVGVESSWRPWAVGTVGEVGLCQVRPDLRPGRSVRTTDDSDP